MDDINYASVTSRYTLKFVCKAGLKNIRLFAIIRVNKNMRQSGQFGELSLFGIP